MESALHFSCPPDCCSPDYCHLGSGCTGRRLGHNWRVYLALPSSGTRLAGCTGTMQTGRRGAWCRGWRLGRAKGHAEAPASNPHSSPAILWGASTGPATPARADPLESGAPHHVTPSSRMEAAAMHAGMHHREGGGACWYELDSARLCSAGRAARCCIAGATPVNTPPYRVSCLELDEL